jgi:hypothetical protein
MTKAQDDSTTIDQAIQAAILAHEEDPESHMGVGESIENHRVNDVIDHPQGSIVADKSTTLEIDLYTQFESTNGWITNGDIDGGFWPGLRLGYWNGDPITYLISQEGFGANFFNLSKDMLVEFSGKQINSKPANGLIGVTTNYVNLTNFKGIAVYFKDNGTCRAVIAKGTTILQTADVNYSVDNSHVWRIFYNAGEKKLYFYIDGIEVATIDCASISGTESLEMRIAFQSTIDNESNFYIYSLRLARGL